MISLVIAVRYGQNSRESCYWLSAFQGPDSSTGQIFGQSCPRQRSIVTSAAPIIGLPLFPTKARNWGAGVGGVLKSSCCHHLCTRPIAHGRESSANSGIEWIGRQSFSSHFGCRARLSDVISRD